MIRRENDKKGKVDKYIEHLIKIVCYISLPLVMLFALTMFTSVFRTGNVNMNVNNSDSFVNVLLTFSLPMFISLVVMPVIIKIFIEKVGVNQLGLMIFSRCNIVLCILMGILSLFLAICLLNNKSLKVSAWTVLFHFFIVAISEETILRGVIMNELLYFTQNRIVLCLANSIIFAFVYHSSEDFIANLFIRVPLGFVLSYVRLRQKSIYPSIMLHLLYNMFVSVIG